MSSKKDRPSLPKITAYGLNSMAFLSEILDIYPDGRLGRMADGRAAPRRRNLGFDRGFVLAKISLFWICMVFYEYFFERAIYVFSKLRLFYQWLIYQSFWPRFGDFFRINKFGSMEHYGILEADSIELSFESRKILQSIHLAIPVGAVTAILGRNGGGKSCLLQIIFGTLEATYKSIRWNKTYLKYPYRQKGLVQYLPQYPLVPSYLSLEQGFRMYGVKIEETALGERWEQQKKKTFGEFSGGERRFWETLMVLFSPSQFVLLDEPFSHLSPLYVEELKRLIQIQKHRKGILITDHLYRDVLEIADRTYLLQNGTTYLLQNPLQELKDRGYLAQ